MSRVALLDVNVLVALFYREHTHHDVAHDWMADHGSAGWATCAATQNGFVRLISNPASRSGGFRAVEAIDLLRRFCASRDHVFWHETVSLTDDKLFNLSVVHGYRQVTDVYLLGLARRMDGHLVTFDAGIPSGAVVGTTRRHLTILSDER